MIESLDINLSRQCSCVSDNGDLVLRGQTVGIGWDSMYVHNLRTISVCAKSNIEVSSLQYSHFTQFCNCFDIIYCYD